MRHADQVAYLERMLRMVRTNTRDDGPGLSHTPVEGYFDPVQYRREVDVLFRQHPIVVGHSGAGAQTGRLRHPRRHRPADPGRARHRRRAAGVPQRLPPSQRLRRAGGVRRQQARLRLPLSRLGLRSDRPAARHHRRHGVRRRRQEQVRPAPAEARREVRPDLGGADRARGPRGREPRHRRLSRPAAARPRGLDNGRLGAAQLRADRQEHELEAGDRHLPRALPLPLPAPRDGVPAVPRQHRDLRADGPAHPHRRRQALADRSRADSRRKAGASPTTRSCSTRCSPTRC